MKNPFNGKREPDEKLIAARAAAKEATTRAKKCLESEDFKEYRDKVQVAREELVEELISYVNPDPVQYAFVVSNLATEIKTISNLLGQITRDAKRA